MKYLIIGTAGHVDHGKSALIKVLTGVDTDRLKEEKERGISIDLGFASLQIAEGCIAGIVDVPGHERFLKNMLAGSGGMDAAILVVAADEGVMPQTKEHLAMLNLYGVQYGLVAVTKIDKVDREWLELVEEDIGNLLEGTFLENAKICRVSSATGEGIIELKKELEGLSTRITGRDIRAPFRMWIDRIFTVKGHGAVVTGSVLSGTATVGDTLALNPESKGVRVRGLEWHGNKVDKIFAGQRAAINLAGADMESIERGMCLSDPSAGQLSREWDIAVKWHTPVKSGTRIRLHFGTGEFLGRIYEFKEDPGQYRRLILEKPLAAGAGDRGIIRLYSPQQLLGGVMFLCPSSKGKLFRSQCRQLAQSLGETEVAGIVLSVLAMEASPISMEQLRQKVGYIPFEALAKTVRSLEESNQIIKVQQLFGTADNMTDLARCFEKLLEEYHKEFPETVGMNKEAVRQKMKLDEKVFEILAAYWQQAELVVAQGAYLALKQHAKRYNTWCTQVIEKAGQQFEGKGLIDIDAPYIERSLQQSPEKAQGIFDMLVKQGILIRVGSIHVYSKTIQYIATLIQQHFSVNPTISVAELRDMLNTSRKMALPLMEYFDMNKYTVRVGDERQPGPKMKETQ
jgi:selenocysteine-specific elongation factor